MLVGLYEEPEKPFNPLEFMSKHIQSTASGPTDIAQLKEENDALKREVESLRATVADLQKKLAEAGVQDA